MCLNPGLDRGLAFLYAQGGSLLTDDGTARRSTARPRRPRSSGTSTCSRTVSPMTASDMGYGWCGDSLGQKQVAMAFEGGWLDPAMTSTYPGHQVCLGADAHRVLR